MQNWIKAAVIAVSLALPGVALAQSLESLVNVQGVRENQLVGYSLVVGLDGTGDKNQVKFTNQTITNMLRQFGVQLPNKIDPKVKNVAAVAVSATLPPMYSRGQTIDVTVSSIGDAKSIRGGTLLLTQLHGADGEVYALAQGSVVVGGMNATGASGSSVTVNTPTAGLIPNGATVEREIPSDFQMGDTITLNLKRPSFKDANNIAAAINASFGGIATAQSSTNVTVRAPTSPDDSALREQVISEAGALSLRIDNTLDYIDSQSTEIISQQQAMVSQINTLTSGIASYNQQIAQAEANGDNASALYDARDQMVEELSGMMDVQVNIDDQGNYNVTLKNGQPLVSGQQSSTIALETNADGTSTMSLTFAGTTSTMTTDTGGSLGALFDYQNDVLTPLTDTINSMASQFADAVNNQLAQGYDLNGNPGEPLFIYDASNADGPLTVNPNITADELAFSSSPDESGNSDNLQALINISTEPLEIANLGSVTVGQACSSIISNIGIYSQQNQTEVDAASNVYSAAQNQQSSVSGVSMDEEAVNLITYQQIYEANLKVISAGAEIFDSVLEMCS
ncbi:flagellar hook-associated protein FlgK [Escherichia coli]|nr:flagellar hook-associated protein FlgK [Escherichia coli]